RAESSYPGGERLVADAEFPAVPALEQYPWTQLKVDAVEVARVDRQPTLVGLPRCPDDAHHQTFHAGVCDRVIVQGGTILPELARLCRRGGTGDPRRRLPSGRQGE